MGNNVRTTKSVSDELRHEMIAEAAYFRAEHTGFSGDSLENWLEAEAEIDRMLQQEAAPRRESELKRVAESPRWAATEQGLGGACAQQEVTFARGLF